MRLERLEINGFKSFSDRSELAFDKGVTAIVGPNGCGKSNVADAITWVMGEQSAKSLRGERMEDVIFGGSDARKPTSAAEVRLRFSGVVKTLTAPPLVDTATADVPSNGNGHGHHSSAHAYSGNGNGHAESSRQRFSRSEAEEIIQSVARDVEVTRRLYRSGESEYLIDGEICRLRDVHDLLMDTGLGAKAYAIIEQGKIGLILSSRPADRRLLIEEAAGVTKYKARRRSAELKLEAAQQNLTRIGDIVFEVDRQLGALKRQAAKARRYRKLREELRRCEKVLFARRYRELSETLESVRIRLAAARDHEAAAAARLAGVDNDLTRVRVELVAEEAAATKAREAVHSAEMDISRREQQFAFDKQQLQTLAARSSVVTSELAALKARREPAHAVLIARRQAAAAADAERDQAAATLAALTAAYDAAHRGIEGVEADVEAARSEVFSAINSATALRHSIEHAASERERVAETLSRLRVEADDVRLQSERLSADRAAVADGLRRARAALDTTSGARAALESELAAGRNDHEAHRRSIRGSEQKLAGLEARLGSLEELEAARAGYGDAARVVLAQANGAVGQKGAIADYLDVHEGYERAIEACVGDLLQHVIVESPEQAVAGLRLVREQRAGRCGFLVTRTEEAQSRDKRARSAAPPADGLVAMSSVVRVSGPYAGPIRQAIGDAWIASDYQSAADASRVSDLPVVTTAGDLFRGPSVVSGGSPEEARGILETRRAIKDLRDGVETEREVLARLTGESAALEQTIARISSDIERLSAEYHEQDKGVVTGEAHLQRADEDVTRLAHRSEQLARERRQAEEERDALDRRQAEARESIVRLDGQQRAADQRLTDAQRRQFEAREATDELNRRVAEAGALHAALVERAAGLSSEVTRLREASEDLDMRARSLTDELGEAEQRADALRTALVRGESEFDAEVRALDSLRRNVREAEDTVSAHRTRVAGLESDLRSVRGALETIRATVSSLDVERATAEGALAHLAQACVETVQTTLDEVVAETPTLEEEGLTLNAEPAWSEGSEDPDEDDGSVSEQKEEPRSLTPEEAIAALKAKIERLGPVNMTAIEQFDELEARHTFLETQRTDLVNSIAQTNQTIKRIDETTRRRFADAFAAINANFQETFSTLFGGGRAGLTLLDENDLLESGIEIIAQPPGKRLQSVQLLSGGEKALTAIALMFGLFKYKPSPFCLLDEIDAPLDDANIARFVEMLRGMQQHTQFILITHNRKTMEIADRLYGVTMEEPGVSKVISVQLN
jgi:chromosome segregation protein